MRMTKGSAVLASLFLASLVTFAGVTGAISQSKHKIFSEDGSLAFGLQLKSSIVFLVSDDREIGMNILRHLKPLHAELSFKDERKGWNLVAFIGDDILDNEGAIREELRDRLPANDEGGLLARNDSVEGKCSYSLMPAPAAQPNAAPTILTIFPKAKENPDYASRCFLIGLLTALNKQFPDDIKGMSENEIQEKIVAMFGKQK